ncbi:serine/threonine-protein kinase [Haliangium sp.]|uniref:serine/threonine-protein kinase n=1 Tax=Haliangium sp. TaxID=2663208 RepID=UPI003D12FC9B
MNGAAVAAGDLDDALDGDPVAARRSRATSELMRRASDSDDRWLGRVVDDRYRVVEVIGRGGMGVVYKVEHQRMGKVAAMKVLHPEYSRDVEVVERFRREAEAVSQLTHPNTVQVFDFGTTHGALYLIMEYVRGPDLNTLIKRDGPIDFERAAPMLAQACAALAEAHALGIVHRDLKPENILITRTHRGRDFIKILDFGLAKLSEHDDRAEVTDRGVIVGTPYYMSPEQIRGDPVDGRTDIYALGAVMYRILTGEYPFQAGTPVGVLTKHLTDALVPPSERMPDRGLLPFIDEIVIRAMSKSREARYPDVSALLDDLEAAYAEMGYVSGGSGHSGTGLEMPETSLLRPSRPLPAFSRDDSDAIDYGIDSAIRLRRADLDEYERTLRRRRMIRVAVVPVLLAAAAAVALYLVYWRPAQPRRSELEPNDSIDQATFIAPDHGVTGYLGKRISKSEPDRDYYRVELPPGDTGPLVVTASVTALPNVDLELSVLDGTGKRLAWASEFGVGGDEWLRRVRVQSTVYLLVTEAMPGTPRLPTENVSDTYVLDVQFDEVTPERESEPNDSASDAHVLLPGLAVMGHLDRRADVDVYAFEGEAGRYRVRIDGAAELPLVWQLDAGPEMSNREAELDLDAGQVLKLWRGGAAGLGTPSDPDAEPVALPGAAVPYSILVEPAPDPQ